jgi:hypothetical protein
MLGFFLHPKTRRIDWWLITLLLLSLVCFAGAAVTVWTHSG